MKTAIDFFSGTGSATQAFKEHADWEVIKVEINEDFEADIQDDIKNVSPGDLPNADFIWASPPCTDFSVACKHRKWTSRPMPKVESISESVEIVYHTLYLIQKIDPDYWFMENPRGMMRTIMPFEPRGTVTYCQYGMDYMKPTDLWGKHPESFNYRDCSYGDSCHVSAGREDREGLTDMVRDPAKRSIIPKELSRKILEAVENPGPSIKQMVLSG